MNLPAISLFEVPSLHTARFFAAGLEGRSKKFRPEAFSRILAAILEFFWGRSDDRFEGWFGPGVNPQLFWTHFSVCWHEKNNIEISLSEAQTLHGITDTVPQCLGLKLCLLMAKYYIYTASKMRKIIFLMLFCLSLKIKYKLKLEKLRCKSRCKNNFLDFG